MLWIVAYLFGFAIDISDKKYSPQRCLTDRWKLLHAPKPPLFRFIPYFVSCYPTSYTEESLRDRRADGEDVDGVRGREGIRDVKGGEWARIKRWTDRQAGWQADWQG